MTKLFKKTMAMLIAFVLLLSTIHIGPVSVANASTTVADGEYPISYRYVKNGTWETSAANYFMIKDTGKLIVSNGKAKLEHEIKKTDYTTFAFFGSRIAGKDKAVIKEDTGKVPVVTGMEGYQPVTTKQASDVNNIIVQVDVEDIGKVQDILMHIDDKENIFNLNPTYNYWYNVGLELDISKLSTTTTGAVVDKESLRRLIDEAEAFKAAAIIAGTAEGQGNTVASDGEYEDSVINSNLKSRIDNAKTVRDKANASADEVIAGYNTLKDQIGIAKAQQYHASTPTNIIVLDTLGATATRSVYSNEFKQTAVLLEQNVAPYYKTLANITFVNPVGEVKILRTQPNAAGLFGTNNTIDDTKLVSKSTDVNNKTYQLYTRYPSADDTIWQGFSSFNYTVNSVTKNVYISYNADQLTALNANITAARQLVNTAVTGTAMGQYPASAKTKLQQAIGVAELVGNNLAAQRPQILKATSVLQTAVDAFKASAVHTVYFSAVHATNNAFSTIESYFMNPSTLTTEEDGSTYVTVTIKNSMTVPEFKIKQNGEFVETTLVSADAATNTRKVKFKADNLSTLLDAKVRAVVPAQNYDQTHSIRLNFNNVDNSALSQAITAASAFNKTAVAGTAPGQYPAVAKAAIQSAIDAASAEASNITGTQAQTATALLSLQQALTKFKASVIPTPAQLADGDYPINYTIYKKGTNENSVMFDYVDKISGKLTVAGDKRYVSFTLKQSTEITSFKTEKNGVLTETEIVRFDPTNNTRTIKFEVNKDLTKRINGWVKIYWQVSPTFLYDNEYDVEIGFTDVSPAGPLNTLIASIQTAHDAAIEGSAVGQYPLGSKAALLLSINQAKQVAANPASTQQQLNDAKTALQSAFDSFLASVVAANASLPDGDYNMTYKIYKQGTDEASVMYDYVDKNSGKLTIKNGKAYASFQLNQSAEILNFQTKQNGKLIEAAAVSSDATANTRVVQFEMADLTKRLDGWVKIYWQVTPSFLYDHDYDVEIGITSITIDLKKPVNDGQYSFAFSAVSDNPAAVPISNFVENAGSLRVQNGKQTATFILKSGVTAKKITQLNADGSFKKELTPQYAAKQSGVVKVLANATTSSLKLEVDDLTSIYAITLAAADGTETNYKLQFSSVSPVGAITPDTSNPANPGTGGTGGNGGTGGTGGVGGITQPSTIADGKYTINYKILKYETDQRSVMQDYVITPGLLTVQNGRQYFAFTLKQSKEITSFKVDSGGSLSDATVVGRDDANNTRVVQFDVKDLSSKQKAWVKIDWAEMNYFHEYDIDIAFDKSSMTKVSADTVLGGAGGSAVATLKDGEYDLDFSVLQYKSNLDSKYDNMVAHPAKLIVKGDTKSIKLTIAKDKLVDDFKVEAEKAVSNASGTETTIQNVLQSATIVSKDESADTRIISFEPKDLTAPIHAQLAIVVPPSEEDLQKHQEELDKAKNSNDDYIPMLQKKLDKIDIHLVFYIDALAGKTSTQPGNQAPTDSAGGNPAVGSSFGDLENHWSKAAVERAISLGIVNGYEDGSFRPNGEISRAEFTVMIGRTLKLEGSGTKLDFADLDNVPTWAKPYLEQAVEAGIISSYEDRTFRADRKITRSEIAVMVARALKLPLDTNETSTFADAQNIPGWASASVAAAAKKGIINGRDNNMFAPQDRATRAEAVTLILALIDHAE
ncbi:Heme-binding NEAT domain-containing protein [Paenibacillus sp. 1_12]|uniref:NEAT domain-containing protein n=1 Tax=Paenibacillus sp. 1_12 TaxID=1566278 RepID=UPI0008E76469|nr:NEAT domain-containing protein [Paenibacillus sp. 1_12]SFL44170.1 Heme-binding NEAT domain-containing protein [Paenibacillus sp. 1_12]